LWCRLRCARLMVLSGRIVLALARLGTPRELAAAPPERAADAKALAIAMEMLLSQVEAVTDREVRTRHLLASVFGGRSREPEARSQKE
jgi:hypothetical protein